MKLWTIQISKHRVAKERGIKFIDTTVKSGVDAFAPSWDMVLRIKRAEITPEEYTKEYIQLINKKKNRDIRPWLELINEQEVAIACYCPDSVFCHRKVLVKLVEKVCDFYGVSFEYMGELK